MASILDQVAEIATQRSQQIEKREKIEALLEGRTPQQVMAMVWEMRETADLLELHAMDNVSFER